MGEGAEGTNFISYNKKMTPQHQVTVIKCRSETDMTIPRYFPTGIFMFVDENAISGERGGWRRGDWELCLIQQMPQHLVTVTKCRSQTNV